MKCLNCGYVYVGNFCPRCGAKADKNSAPKEYGAPVNSMNYKAEKKPEYNAYYKPSEDKKPEPAPEVKTEVKPEVKPEPAPCCNNAQAYVPQNGYPPYPPVYAAPVCASHPPKKEMSTGKIVALVLSITLGAAVLLSALPIGAMCCLMGAETAGENYVKHADKVKSAYKIGSKVKQGDFEYSIDKIEYKKSYMDKKAKKGYHFLNAYIKIKNISEYREYINAEITCYAGDLLIEEKNSPDIYRTLESGKTMIVRYVYEVPVNPDELILDFSVTDDYITDRYFKFEIEKN